MNYALRRLLGFEILKMSIHITPNRFQHAYSPEIKGCWFAKIGYANLSQYAKDTFLWNVSYILNGRKPQGLF